MEYNIIYADPPWKFSSKQLYGDKITGHPESPRKRFDPLETQYPPMATQQIKELQVKHITAHDCACFLWVTDSHIPDALEVLKAWGFTYKTIAFVWIKHYHTGTIVANVAPWTLKSSEICLLGIKGKMSQYKKAHNVRQLIQAERTKHSKKPDEARTRITTLFGDIPRIELFARQCYDGWDAWGNEVVNTIELQPKHTIDQS